MGSRTEVYYSSWKTKWPMIIHLASAFLLWWVRKFLIGSGGPRSCGRAGGVAGPGFKRDETANSPQREKRQHSAHL